MSALVSQYVAALQALLDDLLTLGGTNELGGPRGKAILGASARFISATKNLPLKNDDIVRQLHKLEIGTYSTRDGLVRREREVRVLIACAAALIVKLEPERCDSPDPDISVKEEARS